MRPHIVFVLSDQHNPSVIRSHGDPHVRTPNLDRLTAEGAALDNCYCASPLCVPSRAAMLSGMLGHRTGILTNRAGCNDMQQGVPGENTETQHRNQ